ncbi:GIY-YIG nuclease family protein [Leuconostoc sp. MS02]|uniref:GIY-YIG nuclease family protein n=1 Tax=Leuconostoc aquikimchii TaxID=3236804 RepID=A0ABV3S166_9LACO
MTTTGYVYALENKAFPGYIKIGQTTNLDNRLKQFNNTGIPDSKPTLLLFALKITNFKKAERILHKSLADKRDSISKEYFKASYNQVKTVFDLLLFNDPNAEFVKPNDYNANITGIYKPNIVRKTGQRPNRSFHYLSIPVGAKLKFKDNTKIEVIVIDNKNQVLCRCGRKHSLSRAAICCYDFDHQLPEEQRGKDRNGFAWFSYNQVLLKDIKPVVNSEL